MLIVGVTNRSICSDFYKQIKKISKSKLNYLIIREKDLINNDLLKLVLKVSEILKNTNIKLIVNSNIKVAEKIRAYAVQLSFDKFVSKSIKPYKIVGVSIHSYEEGIRAYDMGADYLVYGHVFETECKKGVIPRGYGEIEQLSEVISIPIIAIGGIDKDNFNDVIDVGASGIAIMSSLMKSDNPKELVSKFLLK